IQPRAEDLAELAARRELLERTDHVVESVGDDLRAAVLSAVEAAAEIVERDLPAAPLAQARVDLQPDEISLLVEIHVAPQGLPVAARVVEDLRGGGGI